MAAQNTHQLQLCFAHRDLPYIFTQPARHFPASKVTVLGEAGAIPWTTPPLIRVFDDAHYVYQGKMEYPGKEGSASAPPVKIALKWVVGERRIARLRQEADFYEANRDALQGIAPQYYGYFTAEIEGAKVACIVLEWCNGPRISDVYQLNLQRMRVCAKLHSAGIIHGDLLKARNFLNMPDVGMLGRQRAAKSSLT
ncbi:hypothetical protein VTO73DRAFT_428 [Trametes versicolor]